MSEIDFNALGQAIDTTFGRSSTPNGASQSVKFILRGNNVLEVNFAMIVNLVNDREMIDMQKKYRNEADDVIEAALKRVKAEYTEQAESKLKLKQTKDSDKFEIIDLNIYNGKRTAYYRRCVQFEIV